MSDLVQYACSNARRMLAVKLAGTLNGIEYLEVRHTDEPVQALKQRTLLVRLLLPVPATLTKDNVVIDGGERIHTVSITWARAATDLTGFLTAAEEASILDGMEEPDHVLVVRTDDRGDFSRYRFVLIAGPGVTKPPTNFDPLLAEVEFSFKVECPSDFDCKLPCTCPPGEHRSPPINYVAKDYQGFRKLMLERMALLAPGWQERLPADVGVTLVEALAYAADEISYRQDAVATEAYLDTARSRISVRRHARLVDYRMHDGCNAQAWVQIQVSANTVELPAGTRLLTRVPELPAGLIPGSLEHTLALDAKPVVFETVDPAVLHSTLNEMRFWTWGEQGCCLPAGATAATLRGHHSHLRAGDVLILVETESATISRTPAEIALDDGESPDADPTKRFAVRLIDVRDGEDPSGALFPGGTTNVTHIRWHADDALPEPLCLSVVEGEREIAVAWGNIVLADHGELYEPSQPLVPTDLILGENLGTVPGPKLTRISDDPCEDEPEELTVPARFRPQLSRRPLTHSVARPAEILFTGPLTAALLAELATGESGNELEALFNAHGLVLPDGSTVRGAAPLWSVVVHDVAWHLRESLGSLQVLAPAAPTYAQLVGSPTQAAPAIEVRGTLNALTDVWTPQPDLLGSGPSAREFTTEIEHDGTVFLRFGDSEHGLRPAQDTTFKAAYRVGNGAAGNVGRKAIAHVVSSSTAIIKVSNPLPAGGGTEPETTDEVRRDAPHAFQVQERAVTEADYADVAERHRGVQRAGATMRWTGSWHTAFVTADRFGGGPVDDPFELDLRDWLEKYRMAGTDLEVDGPTMVPLHLNLHVCVLPGHFRSEVAREVRAVLSDTAEPSLGQGRRGLFHPDNLTFGSPVYLSAILVAVHAVPGVQSVQVKTFERHRVVGSSGIDTGVLPMGRLEIPRLDDDPNFPEHGLLELTYGGGT